MKIIFSPIGKKLLLTFVNKLERLIWRATSNFLILKKKSEQGFLVFQHLFYTLIK